MDENSESTAEETLREFTDGTGKGDEVQRIEGAPPPPPQTVPHADFGASAAMVKDILSLEPPHESEDRDPQQPEVDASADNRPADQTAEEPTGSSGAPMAPDLFPTPKPKKGFWRLR